MKLIITCGFFVALAHAASLKSEKRANGDVGCLYNGVFEYIGSRFASLDGCNACTCRVTGVACSASNCHNTNIQVGTAGSNCVNPVDNKSYQNGHSFTAADGCNTCQCSNGNIMCTHITCPSSGNGHTAGSCVNPATSQVINSGQSYRAADGCNTCTCNNGVLTCTHLTCSGTGNGGSCVNSATSQIYNNGQSYTAADGCNTCTCTNGHFVCSQLSCTGSNLNIGVGVHPGGNIHTGSTCYDNTQHRFHNDGDTYTYTVPQGGCRTCSCASGILTCGQCNSGTVTRTCVDVATNKVYANGQMVKAADGCNTCTCRNARFTCTTLPCTPIG